MQELQLIYLCFLCICADLAASYCSITGDDGTKYTKEYLSYNVNDPRAVLVDWDNNKLYFNHYYNSKRMSAVMDLETKEYKNIDEISDMWCWFTINRSRGHIFAGCQKYNGLTGGLYKLDANLGQFVLIGAEGENIDYVHYSDALYYSNMDTRKLQTYALGESRVVAELVNERVLQLVVDGAGDWLYLNDTAVCRLKGNNRKLVWCMQSSHLIKLVPGPNGDVYLCEPNDGIFRFDAGVIAAPRRVVAEPCRGLAFDKHGNIIYAETYTITRLVKCNNWINSKNWNSL